MSKGLQVIKNNVGGLVFAILALGLFLLPGIGWAISAFIVAGLGAYYSGFGQKYLKNTNFL